MAGPERKTLLGQVLKEMRVIHEGRIQEALALQREQGGLIGTIMVENGWITSSDLQLALGRQAGLSQVDLVGVTIPDDLVELLL